MAKRQQQEPTTITILDAISAGFAEMQSLYEEIEEARANMEENFSATARYEAYETCASELEDKFQDEIAVPDELEGMPITMDVCLPPERKKESRADRCGRASCYLDAAVNALEDLIDTLEETKVEEGEGSNTAEEGYDDRDRDLARAFGEPWAILTLEQIDAVQERIDTLQEFRDEVSEANDVCTGVEFPGWRG